ncbi:MAG: MBL fold metallo-hydrolase [Solobacterium sp.]|nr:MBL fold metallo-hydrolase [Solobacterium sp.]
MSDLAVSSALEFRWINGQCFEFKFNNGKTLITDPWYNYPGRLGKRCPPGFTTDDLEGGDYLFVNHGHGDHTANIQDVYDRFHSTVICHSSTAMEIAKCFHISLTDIYPVDSEGTYYFDGFTLQTYHGTHHKIKDDYEGTLKRFGGEEFPGSLDLNAMGGIFNTNFVLTTDQGFRLAFIGGNDDGMLERLRGLNKPNLIIRNKMAGSNVKTNVAEDFAEWFSKVDTQLLVPMHYETWLTEDPEFAEKVFRDMNRILEEKGCVGRVAPMERGRWYSLNLSITSIR